MAKVETAITNNAIPGELPTSRMSNTYCAHHGLACQTRCRLGDLLMFLAASALRRFFMTHSCEASMTGMSLWCLGKGLSVKNGCCIGGSAYCVQFVARCMCSYSTTSLRDFICSNEDRAATSAGQSSLAVKVSTKLLVLSRKAQSHTVMAGSACV